MAIRVKYLSEDAIESDVECLLGDYMYRRGLSLTPPVPVEEILETHLKLTLDFDNLHVKLGIPMQGDEPDVLGALWVDTREVFIDESLDPEERPRLEGRYRFSLGHEIGHWRLHRHYLTSTAGETSLFAAPSEPAVVCRKSQAKEPIEWQANFFASSLLMPKAMVMAAWHEKFKDANPRVLRRKNRLLVHEIEDADIRASMESFERDRDNEALDRFARPFAEHFKVSPIAMRIRLEKFGLLRREMHPQRSFAGVA